MDFSNEKSHYPYSRYLQETFGGRTYKIVVSSGLTCPTRDGTLMKRGCSFCDLRGSSSFHSKKGRGAEVVEQIKTRIEPIRARFDAQHFIAYFQSYTNTYAEADYLREIYEAALSVPEISGLAVGTRPDCLPDPVIDLLEELAQKTYVSLELGVQSLSDQTLHFLERGHDRACSIEALKKLRERAPHVQVCVHLMFGNPTDTENTPRDAALTLNGLGVRGVKLHQLMVLEHTKLAEAYREQPFETASLEAYSKVCEQFLLHLDPGIYVERLCANATHPDECLAPEWSRDRWRPHNEIRRYLHEQNCLQGAALLPSKTHLMAHHL